MYNRCASNQLNSTALKWAINWFYENLPVKFFQCATATTSSTHTQRQTSSTSLLLCVNAFSIYQLCSYHLIHLTTPSSCLKLPNTVIEKLFEKLLANKMFLETTIGSIKIIIKHFILQKKENFFESNWFDSFQSLVNIKVL